MAEVIEESGACSEEHVVDVVEAGVAAVVGVGDVGGGVGFEGGVEGADEFDFVFGGAEVDDVARVGVVHRDEEVKGLGVQLGVVLARAEVGDVDVVLCGDED